MHGMPCHHRFEENLKLRKKLPGMRQLARLMHKFGRLWYRKQQLTFIRAVNNRLPQCPRLNRRKENWQFSYWDGINGILVNALHKSRKWQNISRFPDSNFLSSLIMIKFVFKRQSKPSVWRDDRSTDAQSCSKALENVS